MLGGFLLGRLTSGKKGVPSGGSRMARRMFKRKGGKDIGIGKEEGQETPTQEVEPTTPLVPTTFSSSPQLISKATTNLGGKETLEGTAFRIKTSVVEIDTILKGSLLLDKMRERKRRQKEQARRNQEEKDLEKSKRKFPSLGRFLPGKAKSLWSRITNYFVTLFWGMIIMRLIKFAPALRNLASFVFGAMNFVINWGGKLLNFAATLVDGAFWLADKAESMFGGLFGKFGEEGFRRLSSTFIRLLNASLMAAMISSRVNMGLNQAAGAQMRNPKFWGTSLIKKGTVATAGTGVTSSALRGTTSSVAPRVVSSAAKPGLQALKVPFARSVGRVPLIGSLMMFAANVFLFGESPGRAAFKAIGAALGSALLGAVGSIVPGFGTLVGLIGGGIAGDMLGGWLYDRIFGGGKGAKTGKVPESEAMEAFQSTVSVMASGGALWAASKASARMGKIPKGLKSRLGPKSLTRRITPQMRAGTQGGGPGGMMGMGKPLFKRGSLSRLSRIRGGLTPKMKLGIGIKGMRRFVKANAATAVLFTGLDIADRLSMGQTPTQAVAGGVSGTVGYLAASAAMAKAASPLLVAPFPGARVLYGVLVLGAGIAGSGLFSGITDWITGANKKKEEEKPQDWESAPGFTGIFHKGGIVPMDMTGLLKGGEIVIDTNSISPAKKMLLAMVDASGQQGVLNAISQFAPYEEMRQKTVIVETPSPSPSRQDSGGLNADVSAMLASLSPSSTRSGVDAFEILHKGV